MSRKILKLNTPHREEVKRLQKCLHYLINAPVRIDGAFGANTDYWLINFQIRKGLACDGIVGKNTYRKIEECLDQAKKFIVCLDAGHGGIVNNKYTTYENGGGKYYIHEGENFGHLPSNPAMFCEGVYNRQILKLLSDGLGKAGIEHRRTSAPQKDSSLDSRVLAANHIFKNTGCSGLNLSLHSNAGKARGVIFFVGTRTAIGKDHANTLRKEMQKDELFKSMSWEHNSLGTLPYVWTRIKRKDFYVLRNLENKEYSQRCCSILVENDFFDNLEGAKFINDPANKRRYVEALVQGIKKIKEESLKRIPKI